MKNKSKIRFCLLWRMFLVALIGKQNVLAHTSPLFINTFGMRRNQFPLTSRLRASNSTIRVLPDAKRRSAEDCVNSEVGQTKKRQTSIFQNIEFAANRPNARVPRPELCANILPHTISMRDANAGKQKCSLSTMKCLFEEKNTNFFCSLIACQV